MPPARGEVRRPLLGVELEPARLEQGAHTVSGLADRRVVLVERLAVVEDDAHVGGELVLALVPVGPGRKSGQGKFKVKVKGRF